METLYIETNASWWLIVFTAISIIAISVWYYAQHRALFLPWQRWALIGLRSLGLLLLVAVLFQPVARLFASRQEPPRVAVIVDNSLSMNIRDQRGHRAEQLRRALEQLEHAFPLSAIVPLRFGRSVEQLPTLARDSFRLTEEATNLELPFNVLMQQRSANIQAIVLLTDGAYNTGAMPLYAAEQLAKPVFAIGIGDTASLADVAATAIVTNEYGFKDVELPVQVTFTSDGIDGEATVVLLDNGTTVARTTVHVSSNQRFYRAMLSFVPQTEGVRTLSARIEPLQGEFTTLNNTISEYVTIRPNKRRIVMIAGAPSPDVSFLGEMISSDRSVELRTFIQKLGAEFYGAAPTAADLRSAESIVLVGFPTASSPDAVIRLVAEQARLGTPLLFMASPSLDPQKLRLIEPVLPFSIERWGSAEISVSCDVDDSKTDHPLLHNPRFGVTEQVWSKLPPIYRQEVFVVPKPGAEVIATIRIGTTPLSEPLIISQAVTGRRVVAFLGYGLYRWKLLGEGIERVRSPISSGSVLETFISNSLRWLVNADNRNVRIRTSKKHYTAGEPVELIADVHDDALNPIDGATVTVTIASDKQRFDIPLQPAGSGRYIAALSSLAGGEYRYEGKVSRDGKLLGTDGGRFSVGRLALEYRNLRMNAELLRLLSERTSGVYVDVATFDASTLWEQITRYPTFRPRAVTEARTILIWNHWILLAAAVLVLAVEWYLRKRFGAV
ncbi:MAG: hypothetical protein N2663_06080 [Chlorobi bacterium]|nr:hypothetical protein [Chlorobiota bacterium]